MRFQQHLQERITEDTIMSEAKGLIGIVKDFFGDMKELSAVTKKAKEMADKMNKEVDSLKDDAGTISKRDANRIIDNYMRELEKIVKASKLEPDTAKAFLDGARKKKKKF